jgi:hypothetical protein
VRPGRSSSNRAATIRDAVVWKDDNPLGPIRLPGHRADEFIADFERIYRGLGLMVRANPSTSQRKIPGNWAIVGDSVRESQDRSSEGGSAS